MRTRSTSLTSFLSASLFGALAATSGCSCDGSDDADGSGGNNSGTNVGANGAGAGTGSGGSTGTFTNGSGGGSTQCVNLECQQKICTTPGAKTTVSGTVYDPSGTLPLYNVAVYVPNSAVQPIADGLSCGCDADISGSPLVSAITDTQGKFVLENVPVGADIPLVIQVGKWRRQITIPSVAECVDTPLTDPQVTRLPRSMAEGNIPRIALTTGQADPLFCLLRRLGLDDSEFGIAGSAARVHFYQGANGANQFDNGFGASPGATFGDGPTTLWTNGWSNYDIVMLSCEGSENPGGGTNEKDGHRTALRDFIDVGGRVFATHYHYNWFQGDAPTDLAGVATFTGTQNSFDGLVDIDQTFPKGMALASWMDFVSGLSPFGQFQVNDGRQHTQTLDTTVARTWVTHENGAPLGKRVEYFSFNAPIAALPENQCGRMVFSDIHVSAGAGDASGDFPSACSNNPLSEQEKALIFMLFDLSACVIPDDQPPCPPGVASCGGAGDPACNGQCVNGCCSDIPG